MTTSRRLEILEALVSTPTAPFHEYRMRDAIVELLSSRPEVRLEEDGFGNLVAIRGSGDGPPGWCFGAHMDHPGFVALPEEAGEKGFEDKPERARGRYTFLGGVPDRYFAKNPPIREYGEFAMWDLPAFEVRDGTQVWSRACDDLVGCAAIVALLHELDERGSEARVAGVFTRAEEVGFVGANHFAKEWPFDPSTCFVSLETSIAVGSAKPGGGAMCRVGDRMSIFDHHATANMISAAAKREIPVQRALLDLGACEASALQAHGIRTAGVSVPWGTYHNCAPDDTIQPEFVEIADIDSLGELVLALVEDYPAGPQESGAALRQRFEDRVAQHTAFIEGTAGDFGSRFG